MLLGKPKDKFEVYNDLDDELVNLFRCVRDRPAEFLLELGLLPLNSRTEFGEWLKFHTGRRDPALFIPMPHRNPEEVCTIVYSSGTTMLFYGIMHCKVREIVLDFTRKVCDNGTAGIEHRVEPSFHSIAKLLCHIFICTGIGTCQTRRRFIRPFR